MLSLKKTKTNLLKTSPLTDLFVLVTLLILFTRNVSKKPVLLNQNNRPFVSICQTLFSCFETPISILS
jgi:hypothetical protein